MDILRHSVKISLASIAIVAASIAVSAGTVVNLDKKPHTISVEYPEGKIETITLMPGVEPTQMCDGCVMIMAEKPVEFEILEGEKVGIVNGVFMYLPN